MSDTRGDLVKVIEACDTEPWSPEVAERRAAAMAALTRLAVLDTGRASDRAKVEVAVEEAKRPPPSPPSPPAVVEPLLPPLVGTFRDRNPQLRELVRELSLVRRHNLQFKEGDPQHHLLFFAEHALVCMTLEYFVRAVVSDHFHPRIWPDKNDLRSLLNYAVAHDLFVLQWEDQADGVHKVSNVRNALMHANFAQAAREAGCATEDEYFQTQYASEVEAMTRITNGLVKQIDPETGRRRS